MARKVFEDEVSSSSSGQGNGALKAKKSALASTLVKAYGEHVAAYLSELFQGIHWDGYRGAAGISFHEFMVWGRKLQDIQLKRLDILFHEARKDAQGRVCVDELTRLIKPAGFTLFSRGVDEILAEMNATRDSTFDFSDYVRFLKACQKRAGFTRFELEELVASFRRFDYDRSDGIDHLELLDLLRFLGYSTHLKEVHQFVGQVDFNGNGLMDFGEFLYLMRLHREAELSTACQVFEDGKDEDTGELPAGELEDALQKLGHDPRPEVLETLLSKHITGNPDQVTFENFVEVVDHFRRMSTAEKRKRAGFSDKEFGLISKLFANHSVHKKSKLEKGELILLLIDAGIPMNTSEMRNEIFTLLDKARESAAIAGIDGEELGRPGSPRCMFWPLVHLLRAVFHKDETGVVHREDQAVDETRFEPSEVQEFRNIFMDCSRWISNDDDEKEQSPAVGSPVVVARSRRASLPSMCSPMKSSVQPLSQTQPMGMGKTFGGAEPSKAVDNSSMSLKELLGGNPTGVISTVKGIQVVMFTRKLNIHLSVCQRLGLEQQVQKITGNDDGEVDFADFLRLMKWTLSTNFSNINEIAEKAVDQERLRQEETEKKVHSLGKTVNAVVRFKNSFQRRKSV